MFNIIEQASHLATQQYVDQLRNAPRHLGEENNSSSSSSASENTQTPQMFSTIIEQASYDATQLYIRDARPPPPSSIASAGGGSRKERQQQGRRRPPSPTSSNPPATPGSSQDSFASALETLDLVEGGQQSEEEKDDGITLGGGFGSDDLPIIATPMGVLRPWPRGRGGGVRGENNQTNGRPGEQQEQQQEQGDDGAGKLPPRPGNEGGGRAGKTEEIADKLDEMRTSLESTDGSIDAALNLITAIMEEQTLLLNGSLSSPRLAVGSST